MESTVKLVFPRAEQHRDRPKVKGERRLTDLEQKVIAFVDDGRPNAGIALGSIREEMMRAFSIQPVIIEHRSLGLAAADPLPPAVFQQLCSEVDAVVVGIAS
ncbi:MAG: hypothetical protein HYX92_05740 [Chloroflexi bacterium]|nr:hypothetical protein [Chloroflexota bacterium]